MKASRKAEQEKKRLENQKQIDEKNERDPPQYPFYTTLLQFPFYPSWYPQWPHSQLMPYSSEIDNMTESPSMTHSTV